MPGKKVELPVSPFPFDETIRRALTVKPEPKEKKAKLAPKKKKA